MIDLINRVFDEHIIISEKSKFLLASKINNIAELITKAILNGNKILIFGNGGSAGDAQHIAAELTGRFLKERIGIPAIALTTDSSALTAIGNDYGFEYIFSRQVESLAKKNDVLLGISTSGNSKNVINAFNKGIEIGTINIALTGNDGGKLNDIIENVIIIPSSTTARIQELHILIGHIICEIIDSIYE
jgi:D-sedoheptulose 7-phosphate isomerase